ncbi:MULTISPECIES: hypothetical protein [Photorhabdus]|uniref:Uncharacterized protein n=2 Tax=Photorhabdus asymbiotica TaxID=291112 RepID=C7BKQ3_PHOAA|nr:hypothetical protein [Photorhabdus asymbiotica]RKS65787.1 hypothetical protein BDD30_0056 [Photorhabdus asymbiotica]CAQ84326.1 conserved hypothetical protein [Photorhabdus asymbiotica]
MNNEYKNNTVNWRISPDTVGSIDNNGLYTAPNRVKNIEFVQVMASDANNNQSSAIITVIPSSVALTPSFTFISEAKKTSVTFKATELEGKKVTWSINNYTSNQYGSIDQNGIYTPPESRFNDGYTFVSITAKAENGAEAQALICLMAKIPGHAFFDVQPNICLSVKPGEEIIFRANADRYNGDPDSWEIFPSLGKLGEPEYIKNNDPEIPIYGYYQVKYIAPTNINSSQILVVRTWEYDKHDEHNQGKAGYAFIEIVPENEL